MNGVTQTCAPHLRMRDSALHTATLCAQGFIFKAAMKKISQQAERDKKRLPVCQQWSVCKAILPQKATEALFSVPETSVSSAV